MKRKKCGPGLGPRRKDESNVPYTHYFKNVSSLVGRVWNGRLEGRGARNAVVGYSDAILATFCVKKKDVTEVPPLKFDCVRLAGRYRNAVWHADIGHEERVVSALLAHLRRHRLHHHQLVDVGALTRRIRLDEGVDLLHRVGQLVGRLAGRDGADHRRVGLDV